jgi:hypothetical protein
MMNNLTSSLKEEVNIEIFNKTLKSSRLIKENLSEESINNLC